MSAEGNKIKIKIVCPALVRGKKNKVVKVDQVIEYLDYFWTNYTDFMVEKTHVARKPVVPEEKKTA